MQDKLELLLGGPKVLMVLECLNYKQTLCTNHTESVRLFYSSLLSSGEMKDDISYCQGNTLYKKEIHHETNDSEPQGCEDFIDELITIDEEIQMDEITMKCSNVLRQLKLTTNILVHSLTFTVKRHITLL